MVLAGVSPAARVSWLEKLEPSESGRRETNNGKSKVISLPKERSCCETTLQDTRYSHTAGRPGRLVIILLSRK